MRRPVSVRIPFRKIIGDSCSGRSPPILVYGQCFGYGFGFTCRDEGFSLNLNFKIKFKM